jgi:hypothetical protein
MSERIEESSTLGSSDMGVSEDYVDPSSPAAPKSESLHLLFSRLERT